MVIILNKTNIMSITGAVVNCYFIQVEALSRQLWTKFRTGVFSKLKLSVNFFWLHQSVLSKFSSCVFLKLVTNSE